MFLSQSYGGQRSISPLLSALSISIPAVSCLLQDYVVLSPPLSPSLPPRLGSDPPQILLLPFVILQTLGRSSLHCLQFAFVSPSVSIFCPLSPLHPLCKLLLVKLCSSLFLLGFSPSSPPSTCLLSPQWASDSTSLSSSVSSLLTPVSSHPPQILLPLFTASNTSKLYPCRSLERVSTKTSTYSQFLCKSHISCLHR